MKLIFDESNVNWTDDNRINEIFVRAKARYFVDLAMVRVNEVGYISIVELYKLLGVDIPKSALLFGWDSTNIDDISFHTERIDDHIEIETEPKNLFLEMHLG
jgi:hypothetical protein